MEIKRAEEKILEILLCEDDKNKTMISNSKQKVKNMYEYFLNADIEEKELCIDFCRAEDLLKKTGLNHIYDFNKAQVINIIINKIMVVLYCFKNIFSKEAMLKNEAVDFFNEMVEPEVNKLYSILNKRNSLAAFFENYN